MKEKRGVDGLEEAVQVEEAVEGVLYGLIQARWDLRRFSKA